MVRESLLSSSVLRGFVAFLLVSRLILTLRLQQEKMKAKVAKIKAHGVTCFVNRQLIYNYPESLFAEAGIMCIEHADFEGVERLALVSGGEIASTFDNPSLVKLGRCDTIEEIMIGEDKVSSLALVLNPYSHIVDPAHQVLWSRRWRGLHRRPSRSDVADDRGGRPIAPRCALRTLADRQGDANCHGWRMRRDGDGERGRRGGEEDRGEEGAGSRELRKGPETGPSLLSSQPHSYSRCA